MNRTQSHTEILCQLSITFLKNEFCSQIIKNQVSTSQKTLHRHYEFYDLE